MIKIGILTRDFDTLKNYELRIIEKIFNSEDLELSLLIKDGRKEITDKKKRYLNIIFNKNIISNVLFKIQNIIESKHFKYESTVDEKGIIDQLMKVKCIELFPERKGFLDIFSKEESLIVKEYELDIILRHEFNIIRGDILYSAKHGIWSFHHGDNSVNRGGPSCFWEIVLNEKYVGVTLQKLTSVLDGGKIIDKAKYNWHYSYYKTSHEILEESVSLLFKNINKLKLGKIEYKNSLVYYNPLYKKPNLKWTLIYLLKFYSSVLTKIWYKFLRTALKKREEFWHLYVSKGLFLEANLYKCKEIFTPKNEFWADPFLVKHNEDIYAFFENFEYSKKKGKITCAKIVNDKFVDVVDVLNFKCHLSYPYIFKEDNEFYMIPETSGNKRLEIYKCLRFPDKWELYTVAFKGEIIVDASYFADDVGNKWLFTNRGIFNKMELHIYKIDSLKLNRIEPHPMNPVKIDTLTARNGGAIFKYNNENYRPSQCSSNSFYGTALNINKIIKLDMEEYIEETIVTVKPNFKNGLCGSHHLHQIDNYFIFDVQKRMK